MADKEELYIMTDDVDEIKDKPSLSLADANRLNLIAGKLIGILRIYNKSSKIADFIDKADTAILSAVDISKIFYVISITIELLDNIYENVEQYPKTKKNNRKRYRHKKKHGNKTSANVSVKEEDEKEEKNESGEKEEGEEKNESGEKEESEAAMITSN